MARTKIIKFDVFNSTSINNAIKALDDFTKDLEEKADTFVNKLADEGISIIKVNYGSLPMDFDSGIDWGDSISVVKMESDSKGKIYVQARGTQILFIEFGTGYYKSDDTAARGAVTSVAGALYAHGGYGKHYGMDEHWIYKKGDKNYIAYGYDAKAPFYYGKLRLEDRVEAIAREVFG